LPPPAGPPFERQGRYTEKKKNDEKKKNYKKRRRPTRSSLVSVDAERIAAQREVARDKGKAFPRGGGKKRQGRIDRKKTKQKKGKELDRLHYASAPAPENGTIKRSIHHEQEKKKKD